MFPAPSFRRRKFLNAGVVLAAATGPLAILSTRAFAFDVSGLRADIVLNGKSYEFAARNGLDMGDFKSDIGGFTQACLRVARDDCPIVVDFRPDRDSDRIEVVFELGRIWAKTPASLGAYKATIISGAVTLADVNVPRHLWFSRWRWQSEPRPIRLEVSELIARKLLPAFETNVGDRPREMASAKAGPASKTAKGLPDGGGSINVTAASKYTAKGEALGLGSAPGGASVSRPATEYTVMGLAGVTAYMPGTGERPDIGPVTEHQGRFICTGDPEALRMVRAQAEAAGTLPWHMRDERAGAPVDLDAYPTMSWYSDTRGGDPHVATVPSDISIDSAHQPSLAYLPYILTGDPYHLEDIQFAANWNRGTLPNGYRLSIPQVRTFAWSLRTLAQAARATPATTPKWLLPKAYWEKDLERTRVWFMENVVNSREIHHAAFSFVADPKETEDGFQVAAWQEDFVATILGWTVIMGFESWRPAFEWKIRDTIARTDGKSGWVRAYATPYQIYFRKSKDEPSAKTWAEAWAVSSRLSKWTVLDPDTIQGNDLTYFVYSRGALGIARQLGVVAAEPCLLWLNGQLEKRKAEIAFKWRLA